jgi:membrane peptidoglycan carboxypeptidase
MNLRLFSFLKPRQQKKGRIKKIITGTLSVCFLLAGLAAIAGTFFFATTIRDLPDPDRLITRKVEQSTKIYDRTGEHLLYELHGNERRTIVELSQISKFAQEATIAVEDKYFYEHKGFRITSFFRAIIANVLKGGRTQGGSTITQQLVKNAILTGEKKYTRKLKELVLATEIERRFTKDQILKMYLNEIPYGSTLYGIESASQAFFGKNAKDLGLAESALLAAIPQSATYYSPYGNNREALVRRWKLILDLMADQGYISKETAEATKQVDILKRVIPKREPINAPHFVFYVRDQLAELFGDDVLEFGGLKVITTLDWEKQQLAEKAVSDNIKSVEDGGGSNASLVSLDPKTGEVLAMVGSRDYFDTVHDGAVNVALRPRQPGSSFKPLVYLTSFIKGYTPNTVYYDVDTTFPTSQGNYDPRNFNKKEYGPVTVRQALQGSLNTPAVKTLYMVGVSTVLDLADRFGYTTLGDRSRFGLSLVLGGGEVTLLEHAAAYGVFATEGIKHKTISLLKVEDAKGNLLGEWKPDEGVRLVETEPVRNLTDILTDNASRAYIFGERNNLTLPDRAVAAKTGTTNDSKDGWTMGYTPSLVAGVWIGNNNSTAMKTSSPASAIWNNYMRAATKTMPVEQFTKPELVTTGKPVLDGGTVGGTKVTIDRLSGKLATDWTPEEYREEKTFNELHDILHYVDRNDPRGAAPKDPSADPMYGPWETAIQKWATKNNIVAQKAPTEYDDIHLPQNRPNVTWISPSENATLSGNTATLEVNASSVRGITRVVFSLDQTVLATVGFLPYSTTVILPADAARGFHTLTATAYDDTGMSAAKTININLNY